ATRATTRGVTRCTCRSTTRAIARSTTGPRGRDDRASVAGGGGVARAGTRARVLGSCAVPAGRRQGRQRPPLLHGLARRRPAPQRLPRGWCAGDVHRHGAPCEAG